MTLVWLHFLNTFRLVGACSWSSRVTNLKTEVKGVIGQMLLYYFFQINCYCITQFHAYQFEAEYDCPFLNLWILLHNNAMASTVFLIITWYLKNILWWKCGEEERPKHYDVCIFINAKSVCKPNKHLCNISKVQCTAIVYFVSLGTENSTMFPNS